MARSARSPSTGSSPLARGLLERFRPLPAGRRIIPARAGFTRRHLGEGQEHRDHPRSRGVYAAAVASAGTAAGSSPLARGLRGWCCGHVGGFGIIPARAGFTRGCGPSRWARRDHPRSRGVYGHYLCPGYYWGGSSPLARGLPPSPAATTRAPVDHPRSRGVYRGHDARGLLPHGSSPLARGLHARTFNGPPTRRIIPARAGFTRRMTRTPSGRGDHPRSRGVYARLEPLARRVVGSSPLARGLPIGGEAALAGIGIIPARAGFTWIRRCARR